MSCLVEVRHKWKVRQFEAKNTRVLIFLASNLFARPISLMNDLALERKEKREKEGEYEGHTQGYLFLRTPPFSSANTPFSPRARKQEKFIQRVSISLHSFFRERYPHPHGEYLRDRKRHHIYRARRLCKVFSFSCPFWKLARREESVRNVLVCCSREKGRAVVRYKTTR